MRACLYAGVTGPGGASFRFALQAQGEYHSARVAQVANHLRSGRWRDLGEAGRNEHTVSHCTLRMLQYVYDFQPVAVTQILPADLLEIDERL
jgi:hypothetical protein